MTSFHVLLAVLAGLVASMAAYAALGRRSDPDAARKGSQFLLGLGDFLVHWFMWLISPAERLFIRAGFTPDVFNFVGLGLGLLSGILIARGHLELGGWAIALGGVCDIFDGRIARALGLVSPYGKFIDSSFDRFVEVFAFLGFVVYLRGAPWGPLLAAGALAGSLLVSYAQARGETVNVSGSGGLMQRAERLVLMCLACLTDGAISSHLGRPPGTAVLWVMGFMAAATFATAAHRTLWIARRLRARPGQNAK